MYVLRYKFVRLEKKYLSSTRLFKNSGFESRLLLLKTVRLSYFDRSLKYSGAFRRDRTAPELSRSDLSHYGFGHGVLSDVFMLLRGVRWSCPWTSVPCRIPA